MTIINPFSVTELGVCLVGIIGSISLCIKTFNTTNRVEECSMCCMNLTRKPLDANELKIMAKKRRTLDRGNSNQSNSSDNNI